MNNTAISTPDFDALLSAADSMTIHALKRTAPLQDVNRAMIDKSEAGFHLETIEARRFGKLTLMPVYSSFDPESFWGWRLSSINGFLLSEHIFSKPTQALRALWVLAQLFDPLLDDNGNEIKSDDPEFVALKNEIKRQYYVVCGIYD